MENKNFLMVSEKFFSIQGEGKTVGTPAVFLRLTGCNLLCQSDSWICDTIEVWKKGQRQLFEQVLTGELFLALKAGAHLVITGGEPMLHQDKITDFLQWFQKGFGWKPVIEIETNGTILPNSYLKMIVDYWNVSPKLTNSGEILEKRVNSEAIKAFNSMSTSIFKFVIEKEEDYEDMFNTFVLTYLLKKNKIYLMPAGENQEQLNKTRNIVVELCKTHRVKYTERLHIVIWNKKTGV